MHWDDAYIGIIWLPSLLVLAAIIWRRKIPVSPIFSSLSLAWKATLSVALLAILIISPLKIANPTQVGEFTPLDLASLPLLVWLWARVLTLALRPNQRLQLTADARDR